MLSSKANAALARLKEIEEKYKMKRKEQRRKEDEDSSISSVSIMLSEFFPVESSKKVTRPKLDIKMPDTRFEGHTEEMKPLSKSETDKAGIFRSPQDDASKIDLDLIVPLDDKSSRSAEKQESLISDIMTIQENSLIESVLDDSVTSKSLSHSRTSRRNFSTVDNRSSGHEERIKTITRSEEGRESSKSSEISRGKASSNSSKQLRLSGKSSEKTSRIRLKNHSIEVKAIAKTMKDMNSEIQDDTNEFLRDDSVIEESIAMTENGSEIISILSCAEENSVTKIENFTLQSSKHLTDKSASKALSSSKDLIIESGYANDTFEDISSSTIRSEREEMINEKKEAIDVVESNMKKIDIAENKSSKSSAGDVTKTDEKKNFPGMTTVQQESDGKERRKISNIAKERMINATRYPVANEDWTKLIKSNSSLEENEKMREQISEEDLDQQISQDVKQMPRKLHKDALVKRHTRSKVATKILENSSDSRTMSEIQNASKMKKVTAREKIGTHCSKRNKAVSHDNTGSRKEDKTLNGKQTRRLRRRIVKLRLQQERDDLQKYLHELKRLKPESKPTPSYLKPLEFPKIAEFTQPDLNNVELKSNDQLRERVLAIRRWLRDQYILYRDYYAMAQTINAHYVPTTLDDAKKTIRDLRNTTIKTR